MEDFQSLVIFPNGRAMAFFRHGSHPFRDLTELEQFAYNQNVSLTSEPATTNPNPTSQPSNP
jgi:hypothetical protein